MQREGAAIECAPFFIPGNWKTVVLPTGAYFAGDFSRSKTTMQPDFLVYGPSHLLRSAFLRGARDYLKEPWAADELFIRAGFRGARNITWTSLNVQFHLVGTLITSSTATMPATPLETELLSFLVSRQGRLVSLDALIYHLYGGAKPPNSRVIATLISRLRNKLKLLGRLKANPIVTFRKAGYQLP